MLNFIDNPDQLNIHIAKDKFSPPQLRLIKSINSLLIQILTSKNEKEYFKIAEELLKQSAAALKISTFSESNKENSNIPYADQAIENSIDELYENLSKKRRIIPLDN